MQVYVYGTKKDVRQKLEDKIRVTSINYTLTSAEFHNLNDLADGTVVKLFTKKDHHGTPIAQAYGVLATKNEKRTLK